MCELVMFGFAIEARLLSAGKKKTRSKQRMEKNDEMRLNDQNRILTPYKAAVSEQVAKSPIEKKKMYPKSATSAERASYSRLS